MSRTEIGTLTESALAGELDDHSRQLWEFVALILDPETFDASRSPEEIRATLLAPNGDLVSRLHDRCEHLDQIDRMRIAHLSVVYPLDEKDWAHTAGPSRIIRTAIDRLSASSNPDAGKI